MSGDSLLLSRRDLEFMLYEWLDIEQLTRAERFADHNRETFDAVLETFERIASDLFEPHYQKSDREEPQFVDGKAVVIPEVHAALKAVAESGLIAAAQDDDLGGMQLPQTVEKAGIAYLQTANIGTAAYPFLSIGNANLLIAHGNEKQIDTFVRPTLKGRYFGTMCLSEPQAGSSLADVATRAEYECDSSLGPQYRLSGSKMWISAGDHELSENIVHLVLARAVDERGESISGVKGLSLFIVPKYLVNEDGSRGERNDVTLAGLNHKMGYRGTTNCLLNFGEGSEYQPGGRGGAVAYRIGELNRGMAYMFHMMNEARIGVGLGATALGYTGYLHALDYAKNRPQGRVSKSTVKQDPIIGHADVKRMLLAQKSYVEGALGLNLYCTRLIDEMAISNDAQEKQRKHLLLEILTPISKSWPSQWCLAANDLAIQVHGGYGYTREFKVEQFYRDNRLNPIHEGTHGIQALDLLGRKVTMRDGEALNIFAARVKKTCSAGHDLGGEVAEHAAEIASLLDEVVTTTRQLHDSGASEAVLANAWPYLEVFGHLAIGWIWLEQLIAAHNKQGDFYEGKRAAARYFRRWELPRVRALLPRIGEIDRTVLDTQAEWL